jgi:hypothetical protein
MQLADGRTLIYKQVDSAFSNPNSHVNVKVLDWLCANIGRIRAEQSVTQATEGAAGIEGEAAEGEALAEMFAEEDLLELYCGMFIYQPNSQECPHFCFC